ncbi:hypothetical protein KIL84_011374, partial [Mauremys mutica]
MSESRSVLSILKRGRLTSPSNNVKYSSFKDSCSTSIFHDSGYNVSLKDPNFDHTDAEHKDELSARHLSLLHEYSEYSHPNLVIPVLSPIENGKNSISLSERKEANVATDFFETPKVSKKDSSLRRRLLLSKTALGGTVGCFERQANSSDCSRRKTLSHVLSFEERLSKSSSYSPRDNTYKPLATSTLKTEEFSPACQKLRLAFSQQRTSTVDDSKCKNNLLSEPECLSPIHHNNSKDTIIDKTPYEFSDSALTSINDESTYLELLRTPTCCMLSETNEDKFLTPVSNLIADFNFDLLDTNTPPTHVVSNLDLSVPEDSGFNSLGLDKSEDSSSDHEGSFQELLQKQKEVSKLLDAKRKLRKLDRVRRLSTLRERGSQSETEEDYDAKLINSEYKLKVARDPASEDRGLVFNEENSGDLILNLGDLSRTPALQVVHEIFMRSKRKIPERNGLLENTERAEMSVLEYILAGLIGKKMGLEKLDILTELKYRDLKHILAIVLGALTVESLCSAGVGTETDTIGNASSTCTNSVVTTDGQTKNGTDCFNQGYPQNGLCNVLIFNNCTAGTETDGAATVSSAQGHSNLFCATVTSARHQEPPDITEDAFEDYLATDDMLVNYFNEFLNLPTFAEPVKFNPDFGVFEVVNDTPQCLESQLKKILHNQKPPSPIYDVTRKAKNDGQLSKKSSIFPDFSVDPNYSIMRLEREQGIQWIKKERLPAFLKSDCYFEYRLAKLLSQVEWSRTGINFIIDTTYYPWIMKRELTPPFPEEDEEELIMRKFYVSLGKATVTQTKDWFTLAKKSQQTTTTDTITHPLVSTQIQGTQYWSTGPQRTIAYNHKVSPDSVPSQGTCSFSAQSYTADLYSSSSSNLGVDSLDMEYSQRSLPLPQRTGTAKTNNVRGRSKSTEVDTSVSIADTPSHTMLRVYLDQKWENGAEEKENLEYDGRQEMTAFQTLDEFTSTYIQYIVNESVSKLTGEPAAKSKTDMNFSKLSKVFIHELSNNQLSATAAEPLTSQNISLSNKLDSKGHCIKQETEEVSSSSRSESDVTDSRAAWCTSHRTYDIGNRNEFERFKKFIKGTLGERYWWLWMDIERLKVLKDTRRQQRQLDKMKKLYLVSSGDYFLNSEVLFKLDLLLGDQWNTRHLKWIQPEVVKPLLLYWGPRFCVTHTAAVQTASAKLKQWHTSHERPRTDIDPYPQMVTLLPLRAKSCIPRIAPSHPQRNETSSPTTLLKTNVTNLSSKRATRLLSATLPPSGTITKDDFYSVTNKPDVSRKRPKSVGSNMTRLLAVTDDTKCLKSQTDRKYTYAELLPGKSPRESVVLGSSKMECMLQSLYVENRAGYFFTRFCEKSGNELWKNSAYFWFDLQAYHQLFYQETLQPFKLCKQAQ